MASTTVPARDSRRQLHDIVREDVPFDEKVREALEVGTNRLEATHGCLIQVDQETTLWEVVVATDEVGGLGPARAEETPAKTFCREVIEEQTGLGPHDDPADEVRTEPIVERSDDHWYLGVPLVLDDELYGTVCFVGGGAQPELPPETDLLFADHLTRLLERELARDQIQSELSNQSNLATVLNRVLRHNLRNDISVIRGYTEVIAEQLGDDSRVETILAHIDDLMQLSDRARELEEILAASSERQHIEVTALTKELAETVASDYPDASIAVDADEEVHTSVLPMFSRALEELLMNAVKHTERDPTVTVTVESVPNAVEIRIEDDGPGLPEQERKVIESGAEAPLTHGSGLGLWLAHWVVDSHDGSIDATVTDTGTRMTVSIPRKPTVGVQQQLMDLTRSRDKYKAAFEEANDAMAIVDDEGRILEANDVLGDIYDLETKAVIGRSLTEFLPDDFDFETAWEQFQTEGFDRGTTTIRSAEGTERVLEYSGTGNIVPGQHLFVSRDVTEQKERERAVEALKERYETLLDAAPDPVFVADAATGELIEVNEAAETVLGMSSDEIIGMHQSELHPSEKTELYQQFFEEHVESGGSKRWLPDGSHTTIVTADGNRVPVEISATTVSLSDEPVIYGIFRDVAEQIEREQELEETTQRLQLALEGTDTGVWDWTIGTGKVRWNESLERLVGIDPGTFEGTFDAFAEYIHPDDREKATDAVEQAAKTETRFRTEYRIQREDGTQIWVESRGEVYDDGDETKRMVGIVTDITERKGREAELTRKTEAIEKAPVGIVLSDPSQPDNPMVYTNEHFCELSGYEESDILGRNCRFMQGPETDPETVAEIRDAIDNEEPVTTVLRNYRNDGTMFWNHVTIAPIRDEDGDISNWVGFQQDATDRIEREQQLELAETVFENTQDALFVIDVADNCEFRIERVNEVYEELTGLSNADIAGKTPTEAVGEEIGSEIESQYRECVERQETIKYDETIPVDGEQREWETKVTPIIENGTVDKLVGAMRDVTTNETDS